MIKANEEVDHNVIKFITIPIYDRRVFLTLFHPSENEQFMNFLEANGIQLPVLSKTKLLRNFDYVIHPSAWPYSHMEMGWDINGSVWGSKKDTLAGHFQFKPVFNRESDNIFHIRSKKWKEYHVTMRNNPWGFCAGEKETPHKKGQWKILQFEIKGQTKYVLSPLEWPCYFIYMTDSLWGHVRGTYDITEKHHDGLWEIAEC
jgi:hypothetical protein